MTTRNIWKRLFGTYLPARQHSCYISWKKWNPHLYSISADQNFFEILISIVWLIWCHGFGLKSKVYRRKYACWLQATCCLTSLEDNFKYSTVFVSCGMKYLFCDNGECWFRSYRTNEGFKASLLDVANYAFLTFVLDTKEVKSSCITGNWSSLLYISNEKLNSWYFSKCSSALSGSVL